MLRFSRLSQFELIELQDNIKDIIRLKKNDDIGDLHQEEIEDVKILKKLFENLIKDFDKLGI